MKPFKPPPAPVTRVLLIACILVQLAVAVGGSAFGETLMLRAALIPARLSGAVHGVPGSVPPVLTLLTSMFLHAGWVHLMLNLVFLAWVGKYCEWALGRWRFVALYLLSGLAGGILQYLVAPTSVMPVVGASGAIAGVFGAYAVLFARNQLEPRTVLGVRVSSEALTAAWYAAAWIGLQLLTAVAFNTGPVGGGLLGQGVAIWAHIGGFITGLLFGAAVPARARIVTRLAT